MGDYMWDNMSNKISEGVMDAFNRIVKFCTDKTEDAIVFIFKTVGIVIWKLLIRLWQYLYSLAIRLVDYITNFNLKESSLIDTFISIINYLSSLLNKIIP